MSQAVVSMVRELGYLWFCFSQAVPLLVSMVWELDAVQPVLQPLPLAGGADHKAPEEVVGFSIVFVPDSEGQTLFRQLRWTGLEEKLLVVYWVKVAPFDGSFVLAVIGVRIQVTAKIKHTNKQDVPFRFFC